MQQIQSSFSLCGCVCVCVVQRSGCFALFLFLFKWAAREGISPSFHFDSNFRSSMYWSEVHYFIVLVIIWFSAVWLHFIAVRNVCAMHFSLVLGVKAHTFIYTYTSSFTFTFSGIYFVCIVFQFVTRTHFHLVKPMRQGKRLFELNCVTAVEWTRAMSMHVYLYSIVYVSDLLWLCICQSNYTLFLCALINVCHSINYNFQHGSFFGFFLRTNLKYACVCGWLSAYCASGMTLAWHERSWARCTQ